MTPMTRRAALLAAVLSLSLSLVLFPLSALAREPARPAAILDVDDDQFPIGVEVVESQLEGDAPFQVVELTLEPGATLSDAAMVVYGTEAKVDAIFAAVREARPQTTSPANVPAGLSFRVKIDPSTTYVLRRTRDDSATGAHVREYTNGVEEHLYAKPVNGVERIIQFPDQPARPFVVEKVVTENEVEKTQKVEVPPGGRLIDYVFQGASFDALVAGGYGLTSARAAADFVQKTGWDPTRWPPKSGERKQIVTGPRAAYVDEPPPPIEVTSTDPRAQARQREIIEQQQAAGIYVERREGLGTLYRIVPRDPSLKTSDVVSLVYGTDEPVQPPGLVASAGTSGRADKNAPNPLPTPAPWQRVVAEQAGFTTKPGEAAAAPADPRLFGRVFTLFVDAADERFVVDRSEHEGRQRTLLANGTILEDWPANQENGAVQVIRYPTGYKRVVYRPGTWTRLSADVLAFFRGGGLALDDTRDVQRDQLVAQGVWYLASDMPRETGDLVDELEFVRSPGGDYVRVVIGPQVKRGPLATFLLGLWDVNPIVTALALLGAGVVAFVTVRIVTQRGQRFA